MTKWIVVLAVLASVTLVVSAGTPSAAGSGLRARQVTYLSFTQARDTFKAREPKGGILRSERASGTAFVFRVMVVLSYTEARNAEGRLLERHPYRRAVWSSIWPGGFDLSWTRKEAFAELPQRPSSSRGPSSVSP